MPNWCWTALYHYTAYCYPQHVNGKPVTALKIILVVLTVLASILLVLTVLMHKGRGGGLSDMFGGGISTTAGSSGVAERNLNRITLAILIVWVVCIVAYALLTKITVAS
ncbi:preprotein translocase subunit SecG [Schaalia radingae]|uniref:Protein-export membrane protein SecG n=1 Tax=Schaalia radingae TaxID=131110 RepID=A0ABY0V7H7_9ACTO|nr:preprotein translocase subunit SecG [Schaalia radingae]